MRLLFKELSRLRRKRIFHPFGVGFAAEYRPLREGSGALALDRESEPLVRLSRSFGLPELLPDPCGLAFRFPDAYGTGEHQDVLLVTPAPPPAPATLCCRAAASATGPTRRCCPTACVARR